MMVWDIPESGGGNGSGGRVACGVAVRGGGERGTGRSSGAGAPTLPPRAAARLGAETFMGRDVADAGAWGSSAVAETPMSESIG
jgi:hypothetical protein